MVALAAFALVVFAQLPIFAVAVLHAWFAGVVGGVTNSFGAICVVEAGFAFVVAGVADSDLTVCVLVAIFAGAIAFVADLVVGAVFVFSAAWSTGSVSTNGFFRAFGVGCAADALVVFAYFATTAVLVFFAVALFAGPTDAEGIFPTLAVFVAGCAFSSNAGEPGAAFCSVLTGLRVAASGLASVVAGAVLRRLAALDAFAVAAIANLAIKVFGAPRLTWGWV